MYTITIHKQTKSYERDSEESQRLCLISVNQRCYFIIDRIHYVDENSVDPDQLASSEASLSGSELFQLLKDYAHSVLIRLNMAIIMLIILYQSRETRNL